jgi:hypothetical protein
MKLDLPTNATVIDDATRFASRNLKTKRSKNHQAKVIKQNQKFNSPDIEKHEHRFY